MLRPLLRLAVRPCSGPLRPLSGPFLSGPPSGSRVGARGGPPHPQDAKNPAAPGGEACTAGGRASCARQPGGVLRMPGCEAGRMGRDSERKGNGDRELGYCRSKAGTGDGTGRDTGDGKWRGSGAFRDRERALLGTQGPRLGTGNTCRCSGEALWARLALAVLGELLMHWSCRVRDPRQEGGSIPASHGARRHASSPLSTLVMFVSRWTLPRSRVGDFTLSFSPTFVREARARGWPQRHRHARWSAARFCSETTRSCALFFLGPQKRERGLGPRLGRRRDPGAAASQRPRHPRVAGDPRLLSTTSSSYVATLLRKDERTTVAGLATSRRGGALPPSPGGVPSALEGRPPACLRQFGNPCGGRPRR